MITEYIDNAPLLDTGDFLPMGKKPLYPNPYFGQASRMMPVTMTDALRWSEFICSRQGTYREALRRICAYCITDPEVRESRGNSLLLDRDVRAKYEALFKRLTIRKIMMAIDMDLLTYGNAFISVVPSFTRYLKCSHTDKDGKQCGHQVPLEHVLKNAPDYQFEFVDFAFRARCPVCGTFGEWEPMDTYSRNPDDLHIKRWNVHDIDILYDQYSETETLVWKIPSDYRSQVSKGLPHVIAKIPLEVLRAVRAGQNFKFRKDFVLHLKEDTLSGFRSQGWGLPRIIPNFCQSFFLQVLMQHTEANALEALAPMRVISPPSAGGNGGGTDPLMNGDLGDFAGVISKFVTTKRRDPSSWFVSPFPLQYQAFGGDATQFMPRDMLEWGLTTLLDCVGIPVEMYRGTLSMQAAPSALRLFETFWSDLIACNNVTLRFITDRVIDVTGWEPVEVQFARITHAEDAQRQMQTLQLGTQGLASRTTALATVGLDHHEELRRMSEERQDEARIQEEEQKVLETTKQLSDMMSGGPINALQQQEQQQQQQGMGAAPMGGGGMPPAGAGMPAGGGPMPGGGGMPPAGNGMSPLMPGNSPTAQMIAASGSSPTDTPADLYAKAQTLANQFLMAGNTASSLRQLNKQDPQLHAQVKSIIEQIRSEASSQGKQQVMQQQFGQG